MQVDFEALRAHADMWKTLYTESTFWFDVHYVLFGVLILTAAAMIGNLFWKVSLMKQEDALLSGK